MPIPKDKTGNRYGRLLVIGRGTGKCMWRCRCDCGTEKDIYGSSLNGGKSQSCGCLHVELLTQRATKHGMSKYRDQSSEYIIWIGMKQRCYNPKCKEYKYYGARGIIVCAEWREDFARFLADMGPKPDGYSIERDENEGNYEPSNCRWIPRGEQNRNTRRSLKNRKGESHAGATR